MSYGPQYVPSVGALSALVNHAGTVAGLILNSAKVTDSFQAAACDEIFFHQQPVLTVVEPNTMAIGAIEKSRDRTAESWQAVLSHFPKLRYVVSDLAQGLIKGVKLHGNLLHQGDLFHFLRDVCLRHALMQGKRVEDKYAALWETLWPLGDDLATFETLVRQIPEILYAPKRASSLVESFNSKLRTVQYVKKQVSQEYLWLLALKHNLEPFAHGKRQGHSPFELLGIDLGADDWVELLRTYQP